jgi:hypothetical protein
MITTNKKIKSILLTFLIGCNLFAQNGPGGVGSTDGASVLTHWLDASSVNNVNVTTWPDKSGYNHSATGTGAQLKTNEINGQPAVKFDGSSRTYYVDGVISNPYTIFSVAKQDGGAHNRLIASNANNWLFGYWGGYEDVWHPDHWVSYPAQGVTGNPAIYAGISDGITSSFYKNGNLIASDGAATAPVKLRLGGWQDYAELSDGKVSELIVYSTVLTSVQRTLVENYLNAKYNLSIANDKYAQPSATAYINGVAGIGKEGASTNTVASAGGLMINNISFLQDSSDYILAGYDLVNNSVTTYNDLPAGVVRRFARDWYIDFTDANANNGLIDLGFDMSEAGYSGMPSGSGYKLLYRATSSGNYTVINSVANVVGDNITFNNINTSTLSNGYYTLALPAATPMAIVDITTIQANVDSINAGKLNNNIITVKISTTGDSLPFTLNSITLNNTGTTQSSDITNYYLYAGSNSDFATATQIATSSNIGSLTFPAMPLFYGDSYFFLTADIDPLATVKDTVDAQCTLVTLSTGSMIPSVTSPVGYRVIAPVLYCHPFTNGNCCSTGISNFTCKNINNSSTPDNQYADYTNFVIQAYKNEPVNFSISTRDNMISTVWVDWNKDGVFNNTNEQMFHSGVYNYNVKGSFVIPASALEGDSVRMRVGTGYASQPMTDPCFQIEHTEWEDYTLKIKNSVNMTYAANYITQSDTSDVVRGDINKNMLRVVVETNGNFNPLNITDLAFNALGSSDSLKDISNYKLLKGDSDSTFNNATLLAQASSLGGLSYSPVRLYSGKNYFWLSYDVSDSAAFDDKLDARINAITIDGGVGSLAASTQDPLGKRTVVPCHPTLTANCCNYGINSVSLNYGAANITGYNAYTDYSSTIGANTFVNDSVHFSVGNTNDQYIAIWVDWNKNRDFESSEKVYTGYNNTTGIFSGNFHVPNSMTAPDTVKIRIATGNTQPSPCVSQYGEFEDYALFINTPTAMIYDSSIVFQDPSNGNTIGNNVMKGSVNNTVLGVNVFTHGNLSPLKINELVLNTNGTATTSDITKYRLYFGALDPAFANATLIKTALTIDTLLFPSIQLGTGKNYFWLTIDADSSAVTGHHLDFECTSIFIDSLWKTPSAPAPAGYYVISEDQYPFGNNSWNVYAYDGYNFDTYRGYYSVGGLDFNSQVSWGAGDAPSAAAGYAGLPVGVDNHSVQYKRKGFPTAKYQLDVPGHDDGLTVYLNGVSIFSHPGCCDSHTNIWTGVLDSTSKITYAWQEGGGASYGLLSFITLCANPTSSDTTATACNSFTWYGNTYTTSGDESRVIPNFWVCDSTITLHLTIKNATTVTDVKSACTSYTWIDGVTYTSSNSTATHTLTNAVGCDSVVTLNLTIKNATTGTDVKSACTSYTWIDGATYTLSNNTATHTLTNAAGCDSVVTLNLTIKGGNATTGTDVQSACTSYTWIDGNTYTSSNSTATYTLTNAAGCDSVVTLNLTIGILNASVSASPTTVCAGSSSTVSTGSSQAGYNYYLRNDANNSIVAGPVAGTGGALNFNTGALSSTTTYNVLADNNGPSGAMDFDGVDDYVDVPTISLPANSDYTIEFWSYVTTADLQAERAFLIYGSDIMAHTPWADQGIYFDDHGVRVNGSYASSMNKWTHVALVSTGTAGGFKGIYLDGVLIASNPTGSGANPASTSMRIGAGDLYHKGKIDEFRVWSVKRTQTEIQSSMNSRLTGSEPGLLAYYTFENGTGSSTVTDVAGGDNNGTLTNMDPSTDWVTRAGTGCSLEMATTPTVTVNNATSSTDVKSVCTSYTWIDGITYTSSNNAATYTLTNAAGCDSVVTLNLTIKNATTGTDVKSACTSYTWIDGATYTSSNNTATHTLTNAAGCDSVVTLNLTIKNATTGTDVRSACTSYTWIDGITYASSNSTATHTLTNAAGCDSVVTLNLTIKNATTGTDVKSACTSYTWIDGITYASSNSTATHTLTNAAGCDSVVTLNLTIKNATTGTDVRSACTSYTWIDGTTYTLSNSTATHTLTNAAGCDSVVTLNLTITNVDVATSISGNTITATTTGASYVWIDCDNSNAVIPGEVNQSFSALASGNYAVVITVSGCVDTSACVNITSTELAKNTTENSFSIYPNPSTQWIMVDMSAKMMLSAKSISIYNSIGKLVYSVKVTSGRTEINLGWLAEGMYIVEVETENGVSAKRIIKN